MSERLAYLGIMGDQLRPPQKPPGPSHHYGIGGLLAPECLASAPSTGSDSFRNAVKNRNVRVVVGSRARLNKSHPLSEWEATFGIMGDQLWGTLTV